MKKKLREFYDKERKASAEYYDICESYNGRNAKIVKLRLKKIIKTDPNFLDAYLFLNDLLQDEGKVKEAEKLTDEAYRRAISLITNKEGNWPDVIEWAWLDNRHIVKAIYNKAVSLWHKKQTDEALNLLRKLLRTNPNDNIGARNMILGIRMGMTFTEFETRFNKGGFYDAELFDWFDENYKKFPDEFDWWDKATEE
ncbi:tetratricopeptide repeat protein [candidate division WOR-3 bacterium]|nr:tetratricopeptide repeat protein [candidate division WOR-3 bacterium]